MKFFRKGCSAALLAQVVIASNTLGSSKTAVLPHCACRSAIYWRMRLLTGRGQSSSSEASKQGQARAKWDARVRAWTRSVGRCICRKEGKSSAALFLFLLCLQRPLVSSPSFLENPR